MAETPALRPIAQILFSIQISLLGLAVLRIGTATFSAGTMYLGLLFVILGVIVAGGVTVRDFVGTIDTV